MKKFINWFKFKKTVEGEYDPAAKTLLSPSSARMTEFEVTGARRTSRVKSEPRIKIAIDESIGRGIAKRLEHKGYSVVCQAGHAEPDDVWIKRAFASGALFIVSPDLDIPTMIEKENYPMIWIDFLFASKMEPLIGNKTKEVKRDLWAKHVHDRIQAKLKFFSKEFGKK